MLLVRLTGEDAGLKQTQEEPASDQPLDVVHKTLAKRCDPCPSLP